ncbi:MAG: hypothetical protein KF723_08625 [Rhizobiaceae bacterium]|nr:hypothetical protein [Rhizobiaceae bacterium]
MLKTAIVALTIVGCDCDAKMCEFIRDEQPQWSTMAECETALSGRIVRDHHEFYPTVIAVCSVPDDNQRLLAMAAYEEATQAAPEPAADAAPTEASRIERIVSGGRAIVSRTGDGYAVARNAVRGTFSLVADSAGWIAGKAVSTVTSLW